MGLVMGVGAMGRNALARSHIGGCWFSPRVSVGGLQTLANIDGRLIALLQQQLASTGKQGLVGGGPTAVLMY